MKLLWFLFSLHFKLLNNKLNSRFCLTSLKADTYPNGDKYVGEFKDGKRHGQGTWTQADGTVIKGSWINGKSVHARNKKKLFKPYAVCIGTNKKWQINTLMNLFQSNNNPAAISFMLDVGCNNSWSTPIRGIDLEEFSRNKRFVGVKTKEIMSGNGYIYAIVSADEWDSN